MSIPLKIYQYQSVVYTDTTTGASPFTLSWAFPGGIPSSGTASTETVFYNIPGLLCPDGDEWLHVLPNHLWW